ncbi:MULTISPECIES: hypothetical protein [Clostridia]|uniref:hypothetical protein n=1 Tax=Clostridia TaxID=186801 RepID=UPI0018F716DF|nr:MULTISPECIES: hypothetical protein [Clostridia]
MVRKIRVLIGIVVLFILAARSEGIASTNSEHHLVISHFLPGSHPIQTDVFRAIGNEMKEKSHGPNDHFYIHCCIACEEEPFIGTCKIRTGINKGKTPYDKEYLAISSVISN